MRRFLITIVLIAVGLFGALSFSAVAQNRTTPEPTRPAQTTPVQQPAQNGTPSNQNFPVNAIDQEFLNEANSTSIAGILMGELAQQRGTSSQVKQFAQAEIQEQQQIRTNLSQLVSRIGTTLPDTPSAKHQAALAQLSGLSDQQFDQAYLDEGGINAHLENAALYQREVAFGQSPDLVALAQRSLLTITQHFTTASTLTNYRVAQAPRQYNNLSGSGAGASTGNPNPAAPISQ